MQLDSIARRSGTALAALATLLGIHVGRAEAQIPAAEDSFGSVLATGFFDGDGFEDIVIGTPQRDADAGLVQIRFGGPSGPGIRVQTLAAFGPGSLTGFSFAVGDFNADGRDDLAVSAPNFAGAVAGTIRVFFGSPAGTGVSPTPVELRPTMFNFFKAQTDWGAAMAAGDFDCDGADDLAFGVPRADVVSSTAVQTSAGVVLVVHGKSGGAFDGARVQMWHQDVSGIGGAAESGDLFGATLVAGNFGKTDCDDLAIGVPFEAVGTASNAGIVHVLFGVASTGLRATDDVVLQQGAGGVHDAPEHNDRFGFRLAAGKLNGDQLDDLVIGAPFEGLSGKASAGVVHVVYGGGSSGIGSMHHLLHQDQPSTDDAAESGELFGFGLAIGDFNQDNFQDLAIGVPREVLGSAPVSHGIVQVFHGSSAGVSATAGPGDRIVAQDPPNTLGQVVAGERSASDQFGSVLAAGTYDSSAGSDLAVGVPGETLSGVAFAGAVNVIEGRTGSSLTKAEGNFIRINGVTTEP